MKRIILLVTMLLLTGAMSQAQTPLGANGRLKLVGRQLSNECGNAVQLRGMSTHGPMFHQTCYTEGSVKALAQDWSADLVRLAMYTEASGGTPGYLGSDQVFWNSWIDEMVELTEKYGVYCIIDWHILSDGNPLNDVEAAKTFFSTMSSRYKDKKHVIYEICNEPNGGTSWDQVKNYAQQVIPVIRANDPNGIILVGTPEWSSQITQAADSPLSSSYSHNVMYTFHFYAGTHYGDYQDRLRYASSRIPVFVSEWGTPEASGDGGPNEGNTNTWFGIMDGNNPGGVTISSANWSFVDKAEGASALTSGACATASWNSRSASGTIMYNYMRGTTFSQCAAAADDDKDGVYNSSDNCASTPEGAPVNAQGCPDTGDSDNDGVVNWKDLCSGTPAGTEIDLNGCPITLDFVSNVCQGFNNYQGYAQTDFSNDTLANLEYRKAAYLNDPVYKATVTNGALVVQVTNADPDYSTMGFAFGVDADSVDIYLDVRRHPVVKLDVTLAPTSYSATNALIDIQLEDSNGNILNSDALGNTIRYVVPLNQKVTLEANFEGGYNFSWDAGACGGTTPCYIPAFDFSKVTRVNLWVNPGAGATWSRPAFTGTWTIDNFSIGYDNATTCTPIRDDDGDGVKEELDLCKNTPSGEVVDASGCAEAQADDDKDGVVNDLDLCANTPAGESVNNEGCGESQLDDDNDGVPNATDQCANTAAGESVNTAGCSTTQLNGDDDADGVINGNDLCANTPSGASVDANGCASSQLDNDNDGTPNGQDGCPNDPNKTDPGNCGCGTPETECTVDCAGVKDGFAYEDECSACVGGTTGLEACTGNPYYSTLQLIPGVVEAEKYDLGGQGVGYNDAETANQGGQFRTDGVDIEIAENSGNNYNIAYTAASEWLEYSIDAVNSGIYSIRFRVASATTTGQFNLQLDGKPLVATMSGINTGGWQTYQYASVTEPVTIQRGKHVLRLNVVAGEFNLDHIEFNILTVTGGLPVATQSNVEIYPVPASDYVTVDQKVMDYNKASVMNITGTVIKEVDLKNKQEMVSLTNLPKGVYLIQLSGSGKSEMLRVVVQ